MLYNIVLDKFALSDFIPNYTYYYITKVKLLDTRFFLCEFIQQHEPISKECFYGKLFKTFIF